MLICLGMLREYKMIKILLYDFHKALFRQD